MQTRGEKVGCWAVLYDSACSRMLAELIVVFDLPLRVFTDPGNTHDPDALSVVVPLEAFTRQRLIIGHHVPPGNDCSEDEHHLLRRERERARSLASEGRLELVMEHSEDGYRITAYELNESTGQAVGQRRVSIPMGDGLELVCH